MRSADHVLSGDGDGRRRCEIARLPMEGWDGRKAVEIGSYYTSMAIADATAKRPADWKANP